MTADPTRSEFRRFSAIATRWMDCDAYGHVNNVVYYSYFDTAVTGHLIAEGGLNALDAPVIGVVVETKCQFRQELNFPEIVDAGITVTKLGRTSVRYEIGLFRQAATAPAAFGHFVHVYIDRISRRPTPIPERIRDALAAISE